MTTPRKRTVLLAIIILAILITGVIHFVRPAREVTLEIGGSPDQTLIATFIVDGTTKKEIVKTPFKRSFSASRFSYSIVRARESDKPKLSVKVLIDGIPVGDWHTDSPGQDSPGQGVKGTIRTPSLFNLLGGEYGMGYVE